MEQMSRASRKKAKKKKSIVPKILLGLVALLLVIGLFQIPKIMAIFKSFNSQKLDTSSQDARYMSILILGVDNDGGGTVDSGHTDSITYVAANLDSKKAVALPIYRDANIPVTCTGAAENINRIYAANGIECLADSVHNFLDLPLDYYTVITIDGFLEIVKELGTLPMTPKESFCSNFGGDKVEYCFTEGVAMDMDAEMLMAYLRYRGGTSGENRANRQVQLLQAIKNKCMDNMLGCYNNASPHFPSAIRTNIPLTDISKMSEIFGSGFEMQTLDVIAGTNSETENGWTQFVDEEDKANKVNLIKQEIFT